MPTVIGDITDPEHTNQMLIDISTPVIEPGENGYPRPVPSRFTGPVAAARLRRIINEKVAAFLWRTRGGGVVAGLLGCSVERRSADEIGLVQLRAGRSLIDLVAADLNDLLKQLDGREINIKGRTLVLDTDAMVVERISPDWRSELLAIITNPNIAYVLLLIGIYGLILEFSNPGAILPGVTGAICLLFALYALQVLPVNYAALALIAIVLRLFPAPQ
mgnify:CR=1 FL=1